MYPFGWGAGVIWVGGSALFSAAYFFTFLLFKIMQHQVIAPDEKIKIPVSEWREKGKLLFGGSMENWKFKCPHCGQSQTLAEFRANGIEKPEGKFYYSCIGRWVKSRGCNWTLGGLFQIHKTEVVDEDGDIIRVFEFAE